MSSTQLNREKELKTNVNFADLPTCQTLKDDEKGTKENHHLVVLIERHYYIKISFCFFSRQVKRMPMYNVSSFFFRCCKNAQQTVIFTKIVFPCET